MYRFRVYADGNMYYPSDYEYILISGLGFWSLNRWLFGEKEESELICDSLESENPHLMLSSELLDKNGNIIYEHDIIRPVMINGSITDGVVMFKNGSFMVKQTSAERLSDILALEINPKSTEVVGNIHEGLFK